VIRLGLIIPLFAFILGALPAPAQACALRVGWDHFEPYQMRGPGGVPSGLDVEIMQHVLKLAGCTVSEYREAPWTRLLVEVEKGRVDVILSANFTEKRNAYGRFSRWHRAVSYAAISYSQEPVARLRSIADIMAGDPMVGTYRKAYLPPFVTAAVEHARVNQRLYEGVDFDKMLDLLEKGRLQVMLVEVVNPDATFQRVDRDEAFQVSKIEGSEEKLHFLYSRKSVSAATVTKIDAAIAAFVGSAGYKILFRKYLGR